MVKTLIETRQVIPDFLQSYIPEGFNTEGEGNLDLLKFEADSDFGEEDATPAWNDTPAEEVEEAAPASPVPPPVVVVKAPAAPAAARNSPAPAAARWGGSGGGGGGGGSRW